MACGRPAPRAAATSGAAADPAAMAPLEEQLRHAMVSADTATLARLWAPAYRSTSAVGHTTDRAQSLMAYGAGLVRVDTAVVRDITDEVRGDTTVSVGLMDWAGTAAGQPFGGTVRFQHVWVRTAAGWQLVESQLTSQP